ncbi:MAG: SDR family NAD(P)-dependent oxidoreductase [Actinobacteria bacterium]|nr:SDR family NAD(P)-dependent oxidoreductase [Actinomycetota bacterium]
MTEKWTVADIPDQSGRRVIVTGANSGLGFETSLALATRHAAVTMAVRDTGKGEAAAADIRARTPGADVEVRRLDLADLASIDEFAWLWRESHPDGLDMLINNAGIMAIPRRDTADGFEMQLGTNHLGHFALTGRLLEAIRPEGRIVTVSSQAHRMGRMDFEDLMGERKYGAWRAYGQSKLANLLFMRGLAERLERAGSSIASVAAHPGFASTHLQAVAPEMKGRGWQVKIMDGVNKVMAQSAAMGALPTLYSATFPAIRSGDYVGPDGFGEQRGHPKLVGMNASARDDEAANRLWTVSEELTGVRYLDD